MTITERWAIQNGIDYRGPKGGTEDYIDRMIMHKLEMREREKEILARMEEQKQKEQAEKETQKQIEEIADKIVAEIQKAFK